MQPYRSNLEALEARHAALEAEVADRVQQRDEAARMLDEARSRQRDADVAADLASGGPDRRRRRSFVLVFAGLAIVAAFIGMARVRSTSIERERFYARVMLQFEKHTTDACACKDTACITALNDRMTAWGNDVMREMDNQPLFFDEQKLKRSQELGERLASCMTKAMTTSTPDAYQSQEGGVNGAERE
jgi:hypothetical protein